MTLAGLRTKTEIRYSCIEKKTIGRAVVHTRRVLRVSSVLVGVTQHIIAVFEFPPRAFCSRRVSLLSR